jgi:hypothetical protein
MRGIDFSKTRLEDASVNGARISGAYFPIELSAQEIMLCVDHGARMATASSRPAGASLHHISQLRIHGRSGASASRARVATSNRPAFPAIRVGLKLRAA